MCSSRSFICSASTSRKHFILSAGTTLDSRLIRRKPQRQSRSLPSISESAQRRHSAKLISCQQSSKTQKQTWESIYRQPSNPSTIQTDSRVFLLEELFLPAEPRLSLQLPVLGLFKLISLRLPRGSI